MQAYEQYKDSGIEWLGEIPAHWEVKRLKHTCNINANSLPETTPRDYEFKYVDIGNVSFVNGIEKTEDYNFKNSPSRARRIAKENDTIVSTVRTYLKAIDFINTEKSNFIYSTGFAVLEPRSINPRHLANSVRSDYFTEQVTISSRGMSYPAINATDLSNLLLILPPLPEQEAIAAFLDDKCGKIDDAVRIKEQQIEKLKELRQITIHHAVTKGINPEVEMKDSGIEWIGEIPRHWGVKRLKNVLKERNERSIYGLEDLFMVSQTFGLVKRKQYHEKAQIAKSHEGNKIVKPNDLVFNKLKPHLGVFFKNNLGTIGIVSPDYAVYYSDILFDLTYLEYLFRTPEYINQFKIKATGIVEGLIRLYTSDLFSMHIALPNFEEQEDIIKFLGKKTARIDQAITLKTEQIAKIKEYRQCLINEVVTGKVMVNG